MKPISVPIVVIGLVGVHFEYTDGANRSSVSGCGSLEHWLRKVSAGDYRQRHYGAPLSFHHAVIIDKREPLSLRPSFCFASPLVDLRLAEGAIDRFIDTARGSMVADFFRQDETGNFYGTLVRAADEAAARHVEPGPLDSVDLQTYARWWRARGARLGIVIDLPDAGASVMWTEAPRVGADTGIETPVLPEFAAQGVAPAIPFCVHCLVDGHDTQECPHVDPWLVEAGDDAR